MTITTRTDQSRVIGGGSSSFDAPPPEALLTAVADALSEMVCTIDLRGRLLSVNRAARPLIGEVLDLDLEPSLHARIHRRRDGSRRPDADCPVHRTLAGEGTQSGEDVLTAVDGRRIPVAYRCAPVLEAGQLRGAVLTMRDLSGEHHERHRSLLARRAVSRQRGVAAQARRDARRAAALEKAKARFLSIASHELRSPLTVLRGYLEMLEAESLGRLSSEVHAVLPLLSAKVAQMNRLVDSMLEVSRLEDGRLELRLRVHDLRDLVAAAAASVEGAFGARHSLSLLQPPGPVAVCVDQLRIQVVVANLLGNAAKYSPEGGPVSCSIAVRGDEAVVEVTDSGVGIASEDIDRLFTRFSRITTERTAAIAGTGLGLYLARELAHLHGGEIDVRSVEGRGSTFTLRLPLQRRAGLPMAERAASYLEGSSSFAGAAGSSATGQAPRSLLLGSEF